MLTDEEALRKAEGEYMMNGSPEFRAGFTSALAWLRSQGEPVAWQELDKNGEYIGVTDDPICGWATVPLYLAPQPAIPTGWQPIETAPKDELILVGPTKRMGICAAMNHSRDGWSTETPSEWVPIYTPTCWMPLPAAPEPKSC